MRSAALLLLLLATNACSSSDALDEPGDGGDAGGGGAGDATAADAGDAGLDAASLVVDAAAYVDTCTTSADCVLVQAGNVCNPCPAGSFTLSLNVSQEAQYDQAFNALKAECPPLQGVVACPNITTFAAAVCTAGQCGVCTTPGCDDAGQTVHYPADAGDAGDGGT